MDTYIFILVVSVFFSFLDLKKKKNRFTLIPVILGFFLFSLSRSNLDYKNYLRLFNELPMNYLNVEKGFVLLLMGIKKMGFNYEFVVVIVSFFFFYNFFFSNRNRNNLNSIIFLNYVIFFFLYDINTIRNTILITLIYIGIVKSMKKKYYYYMANIIALFFHRLAICYFLFGFLKKIKLKNYTVIIVSLLLLGYLNIYIFKYISLELFPQRMEIYYRDKIGYGFLLYYIMIFIDNIIFFLVKGFKKNTLEEELYLKFYLFIIIFLPYSILSLALISRLYRNTVLIKLIFISKKIKKINFSKQILALLLILINSMLPQIVNYYSNKIFFYDIINGINI